MKKFSITVFISALAAMCAATTAPAQTADEYAALGNSAYKKGDYAAARDFYNSAKKAGGNSAELHFNSGNAAAKLGKKGEAMLDYLRAKLENPRLREADANLKMLAADNNLTLPQKTRIQDTVFELSDSEWTVAAFTAFWCAVLSAFVPPLWGRRNAAYVFLAIIFACATACSVFALAQYAQFKSLGVALEDDVQLRISPTPHAKVSATLQEGTLVKILQRHGDYVYAAADNGKRGWAQIGRLEPVVR